MPEETPPQEPEEKDAPRNKGGRPTRLTPQLIEKALKAAKLNLADATICKYCRIHPDTLINWRHRARTGEKKFVEFFQLLDEARAEGCVKSAEIIAGSSDWRAQAFLLERAEGKQAIPVQLGGAKDAEPIKIDQSLMPPVYVILQNAEGIPNPYNQPETTLAREPGR